MTFDLIVRVQSGVFNPIKISHMNKAAGVSFNATSVSCMSFSGRQARILGVGAYVRDSQRLVVSFQLDIADIASRFSGRDTFHLQLSNGYLASGNVSKGDILFNFDRCNVADTSNESVLFRHFALNFAHDFAFFTLQLNADDATSAERGTTFGSTDGERRRVGAIAALNRGSPLGVPSSIFFS